MSESEKELEKKLNDERQKVRLNALKMLKFLGYSNDASKMTQEQIDARIELLLEQRKNAEIEATKKGDTSKPAFFNGIDEERENKEAVQNAAPSELDLSEHMKGYDALTAQIQILRPNSQVGHMESLAPRDDIRIIRLPASIKLNEHHTITRRVVL
jgi:hypothetical protein